MGRVYKALAAALSRPNIVAVYDIGDENGLLYTVSSGLIGHN
jgi:hypothetical protein